MEDNDITKIGVKESSDIYAVDCGTMFFQVANKAGNVDIIRNAFVEISDIDGIDDILDQNGWKYVKDGHNTYYVIGEDSLRVAQMFPGKVELRRPMKDGVLNKNEDKKMIVLAEIIRSTIGDAPNDKSIICTCVSSESVDASVDSTYHKARLASMFTRLGWKVKVIEEGYAVVLSECPVMDEPDGTQSKFSGIGMSFGSGRSNAVLAYKALPIVGMSCVHSGDWISEQVADQLGIPVSQVTAIKEKKLDFKNLNLDDDVIFALDAFYSAMIKNVFNNFAKKFKEVKSNFEAPIEVVIAGGTSMPNGFCEKVESVIRGLDLPFGIKSVRHASSPRNAVVKGCLAHAIITKKKIDSGVEIKDLFE